MLLGLGTVGRGTHDRRRTCGDRTTVVGTREPFRAAVERLTAEDSALSLLELATVAVDLAAELDAETRTRWDLEGLLTRSRDALESGLLGLARAEGDWSISVPRTCGCRDCGTLHAYLSSAEITLPWPLAKERRRHIHGKIEGMGLPVTHETVRRGSPHTLVLTKTEDLFRREAELRRQYEQSLARIDRQLDHARPRGTRKRRERSAKRR